MKNRCLHLILYILSALAIFSLASAGQASTVKERRETFNIVWLRVKERYYDPGFNGVNWNKVKRKYSAQLSKVKTDDQLHDMLNRMLGELKCSHFAVIPPSYYIEDIKPDGNSSSAVGNDASDQNPADDKDKAVDKPSGNSENASIGITVQLLQGKPVITRVEPGSSAEQAGIRSGFIITRVAGKPIADLQKIIAKRKERPALSQFILSHAIDGILSGKEGSEVGIRYLDDKNKEQRVILKRRVPAGTLVKFGELPEVYATLESRRLDGGIGYIRFNIFMMSILNDIKSAIHSFYDAPGIIIDLRGNPGGIGLMAVPIAAMFMEKPSSLGTMKMRKGEVRFMVFPATEVYKGKLVILVDETSASTSEILAAGMQANGRAVVVGRTSVGAALPSVIEKLPTGARLQYAIADFKTPKGVLVESRGVIPDIKVEPAIKDLLEGRDTVIEKAAALILEQTASGAQQPAERKIQGG